MNLIKSIITKKKGFTLIEIIVSLALIGLMAIIFIPIFNFGYSGILSAGKHSKAGYLGQQAIENYLAGNAVTVPNTVTNTTPNVSVSINFQGTIITVTGVIKSVSYEDGRYQVDVSTFIKP
jgi:prepilin-type N-terminal cleavage/methylation domain-containing protein